MVEDNSQQSRGQLLVLMREQYSVYQDILRLAKEKTSMLIDAKPKEIENLTAEIVKKLEIAVDMETRRQEIIETLAQNFNIPQTKISLLFLIQRWNDAELASLRQEFNDLLKQLRMVNERNAVLLQNAQGIYAKLQEILYSFLDRSTGYNDKGQTLDSCGGGYFEKQV